MESPDLDAVSEQWLQLVRPVWFKKLSDRRKRRRPLLLKDIERDLIHSPIPIEEVERHFDAIPTLSPLDKRISACIVGIPEDHPVYLRYSESLPAILASQ